MNKTHDVHFKVNACNIEELAERLSVSLILKELNVDAISIDNTSFNLQWRRNMRFRFKK